MAARVIHFGPDDCYRLNVLRRAGYDIAGCNNLVELCKTLESDAEADAVLVNDSQGSIPLQAISTTRSRTSAPIILFPHPIRTYDADKIDLLVAAFTPPEEWLLDLANLIIHFRTVRAVSRLIRGQSEMLRRESAAAARAKSLDERRRARQIKRSSFPSSFNPNSSSK
jgi:hypothetical protein